MACKSDLRLCTSDIRELGKVVLGEEFSLGEMTLKTAESSHMQSLEAKYIISCGLIQGGGAPKSHDSTK